MRQSLSALFFLACAAGCYKNHLYVQQQKIDQSFLASSHVGTPDPRQKSPPVGQKLLVAWSFPWSLFSQELTAVTTVRLWDQTEVSYRHTLERKRDSVSYFFPNPEGEEGKKILTYRVQVVPLQGDWEEVWEHHFWTPAIAVDRESASSPQ